MKRTDIERMISLADDRYIDEIFQDKITGKRKNIFVTFTAVAAALALVAVGINCLVSNAGNADKITANDPIITEVGTVDYSLYFQNYDEPVVENDDWSVGTDGIFCYFSDSEYLKSVMPFDMSGYVYTDCHFYYNYKDEVKTIAMHANNRTDDKQENVKMLNVEVYEQGELFPHLALEKCKSMKRFGVDVYGFDLRGTDNGGTVGVIFAMDGKEYLIAGNYISYDEIGIIMDSIIENGLWTDRFDLSKAEVLYNDISADITLEEANLIKPFTGYVPQIYNFGDMILNYNKVSYFAGRNEADGIVPKWLYFTYFNGSDKDICLQYFTEAAVDEVQPLEKTVAIEDIDLDKLSEFRDDGNNHAFTIDFCDFKVNVWTNNCNDEELMECITAMHIGANVVEGSSYEEISLDEARADPLTAGLVPQTNAIGDMSLENGTCKLHDSGRIVIKYSNPFFKYNDERFNNYGKYLTASYTENDGSEEGVTVFDEIEPATVFDLNDNGVGKYKFILDCGDIYIRVEALCNHSEMREFLTELKNAAKGSSLYSGGEPGSLEYSNKLEPFAGYVPTKQDVLIYDKEELGESGHSRIKYLHETVDGDGALVHMHLRFYRDIKNLTLDYYVYGSDVAASRNIGESVVKLDDVTLEILKPIFGDGNSSDGFIAIDCGKFFMEVHTENCSADDVWAYVSEIKGNAVQDADNEDEKILTIYKVKELAKKGDDLTWSDFDGYTFTEGGSGLYIKSYSVEGGYNLMIGGEGRETKPMYIYLSGNGKQRIDIRYDSIDDFLADDKVENLLTMDKVKELAKKGDDLTWSDFEAFSGKDVGFGLYIMAYDVEGMDYTVLVGGVPDSKPMYIYLKDGDENSIDIRYDSIDEFLNEN